MNFTKAQHLVCLDLAFQLSLLHGDGNVVNESNSGNIPEFMLHIFVCYLNSARPEDLPGARLDIIQTQPRRFAP
jgi:hypothetical protein